MEAKTYPEHENMLLFLIAGWDLQREFETGIIKRSSVFYPYSEPLRVAWNALALHGMTSSMTAAPVTLTGFRKLCCRSIGEWLPPEFIPEDFPSVAPILYSGSAIELSEPASDYLDRHIFNNPDFAKNTLHEASRLQRFLENQIFVEVHKQLKDKPWSHSVQQEYTRLRRFLIEHPYTTRDAIVEAFATCAVLNPAVVGSLYQSVEPDTPQYRCEWCGVLRVTESGQLVGGKPNLCSDHAFDAEHVHQVVWEEGLCCVKPAINARVTLHGIAEVAIFDRLHALQKRYPKRIQSVEEWPGTDTYDLRVIFSDDTRWAIDIKDYASPYDLARQLVPLSQNGEHLDFDLAFYVVPNRRTMNNPHYLNDARSEGLRMPVDYELCDADYFVAQVESYRPRKVTKA